MSKSKQRFVIWGYGSENIFQSFGETLISEGHEVFSLPCKKFGRWEELEILLRAPYILLTSAHFGRDTRILRDFYPDIHIENEFLDLLHHCPPILSVFYPHDLATPLVINEPLLLHAFDLVLWPTPFFGYQPRPKRLIEVGWIGFREPLRPMHARRYDSVLLFSDVSHHMSQFGVESTHRKLFPILETGTAIKFPKWPGHEAFEEYFAQHGAHVIPADTPAGSLIQDSRLIISNSLSSISVEAAYMGTPVINLLEDYLPEGLQERFLAGLPGCVLSSYSDFPFNHANPPLPPTPQVKPFDAAQVLKVILTEAEPRMVRERSTLLISQIVDRLEKNTLNSTSSHQENIVLPPSNPEADLSDMHDLRKASVPSADVIDFSVAMRLLNLDRVEEAFAILQRLVNAATSLAGPYHQIALLALKQNETSIAEEFLSLACEREIPPGDAHLELAQLFFRSERFDDTLKALGPLLRSAPARLPETHALLRRTLGAAPELSAVAWWRLITDLRWKSD